LFTNYLLAKNSDVDGEGRASGGTRISVIDPLCGRVRPDRHRSAKSEFPVAKLAYETTSDNKATRFSGNCNGKAAWL
jgi:hypothetical protein